MLSKTTFGGLRNWGWSGRRLFLLREMTESRQKRRGGETYRRWEVQKRFWGGVFRRIYGMFSTPLSFPPPLWGSPKASHIKASHPHFPHFPRFRVRIFRVFRVFALRNLLRPLFFWGEKDFLHFPRFRRIGFESLISKIRPTGFRMTGLR